MSEEGYEVRPPRDYMNGTDVYSLSVSSRGNGGYESCRGCSVSYRAF